MTKSQEDEVRHSPPSESIDDHAKQIADKIVLSVDEKRQLLHVARTTLERYLTTRKRPLFHLDSPAFSQERAVFVTLWRRDTGELRGCRGESMARRPLLEAVSMMAIASAVDDPRFTPVTSSELPHLRIDINALTPLLPIQPEDMVVGKHGLMILRGHRAGLLLPDVPVRIGWDRLQFLDGVCEKAGLPAGSWQDRDVTLLGFESEEWGED